MCSLQPVQYMNHNVSGLNQNFYGSHNYYSEDSSSTYLNPRIPFNTCPRVPPGYITPQYHPNSSTSVRFHGANMPWLPQASQVPIRMKLPWVPIPTTSTSTTNFITIRYYFNIININYVIIIFLI